MSKQKPRDEARFALRRARDASRRADYAEADRWTKLAERQAAAAERLAAMPPDPESVEGEEALRAEIRARVARFVDMSNEVQEWEYEKRMHEAYAARAAREGLPPPEPLRPCPHTEADLETWAKYCFTEDAEEAPQLGGG